MMSHMRLAALAKKAVSTSGNGPTAELAAGKAAPVVEAPVGEDEEVLVPELAAATGGTGKSSAECFGADVGAGVGVDA